MAERLRAQGRSLHEELDWLGWRGEQVYCTLAHNDMASWAIVDQLTPLLPKDNEQVAGQVKQVYSLPEAEMITDLMLVREVGRQVQETNYR
jgi:hypothetical protein